MIESFTFRIKFSVIHFVGDDDTVVLQAGEEVLSTGVRNCVWSFIGDVPSNCRLFPPYHLQCLFPLKRTPKRRGLHSSEFSINDTRVEGGLKITTHLNFEE